MEIMKRQIERAKVLNPEEGLKHVDPECWRSPPGGRDWVEYIAIAICLIGAAYLFG